jgi:hypothetical protein
VVVRQRSSFGIESLAKTIKRSRVIDSGYRHCHLIAKGETVRQSDDLNSWAV